MNKTAHIKTALVSIIMIHLTMSGYTQNWQWAKSGKGNQYEFVSSMTVDDSGNVYVVGGFASDSLVIGNNILINDSAPLADMYLAKLDANGNVLWTKRAGGTGHEFWTSVTLDNSGNVCVAGAFTSQALVVGTTTLNGSGFYSIAVAKYSTGGNLIWAQGAGGSSGSEFASSITADAFGNIFVTGGFSDTLIFGPYTVTGSMYIVKYDNGGNVIWAKNAVGGADGKVVTSDASGNIYVAGVFNGDSIIFGSSVLYNDSADPMDLFLVKYTANGNVLWARSADGGSAAPDFINVLAITLDASGNVYIAGAFLGETISFGPYVLTNDSSATYDAFIAKYDSSGNMRWAKSMGGSEHDGIASLAPDGAGAILMSGYFASSAISFDAETLTNVGVGTEDIFMVKIDTSGATIWAERLGGTGGEGANAIASHASGDIYLSGSFVGTTLSFGSTTLNNTNPLEQDIYIAKMGLPLRISDIETLDKISVYPNPTSGKFIISGIDGLNGLEIYDILGKKIVEARQVYFSGPWEIDLSPYPAGIYYLRIRTEDAVFGRKIILQ